MKMRSSPVPDPRRLRPPRAGNLKLTRQVLALTSALTCLIASCTAGGGQISRPTPTPTTTHSAPLVNPVEAGEDVPCSARAAKSSTDVWDLQVTKSPDAGLVVHDLSFGPRDVARSIAIPWIALVRKPKKGPAVRLEIGHLTPTETDTGDLRASLVSPPTCSRDEGRAVARYRVRSVKRNLTFLVEQSYRFDAFNPVTRCEASLSIQCVRFWPTVTWVLAGNAPSDDIGLNIVQRFAFDPDGMGTAATNLTADRVTLHELGIRHLAQDGTLLEAGVRAVLKDGTVRDWENWHQSSRMTVELPGTPRVHVPVPIPVALPFPHSPVKIAVGSGYAGCSECVHAHWSWFGTVQSVGVAGHNIAGKNLAQLAACKSTTCWTEGRPQILPGSQQSACAGWIPVAEEPAWADTDWCGLPQNLGRSIPLGHKPVAFYWDARTTVSTSPNNGISLDNATFSVGDSLWPQLPAGDPANAANTKYRGDTGAMFVVPARRLALVSEKPTTGQAVLTLGTPFQNSAASSTGLPAGWVQPVTIALSKTDKGPYYLRVHAPTLTLRNQAINYLPTNTADPWVYVYDDAAGTTPGRDRSRLPAYDSRSRPGSAIAAYAVFDRAPTTADPVTFALDAAPDGVAHYEAAFGPVCGQPAECVALRTTGSPPTPTDEPTPTSGSNATATSGVASSMLSDFSIHMQADWQYNLHERGGLSNKKLGGGLASTVGVYPEGLRLGVGEGYLLPIGTVGGRAACFSLLVNSSLTYVGTWGPDGSNPMPWSRLTAGREGCVNSGNNFITLFKVTQPWDGHEFVVDAKTWKCDPPAGRSVC